MRRLTAACLLVTAAAALTGCASTTPAGSKAVATSAAAATTEAAAPPTSAPATTSASPGPSASTSATQAWALKSSQFNTVISAVIPMAGTITSANGDAKAKAVGKACTAMAATVNGLQPEAGAPQEWAQVLGDLQKVATRCDAVTSGDPAAYEQLDEDFADAMAHLEPLVG